MIDLYELDQLFSPPGPKVPPISGRRILQEPFFLMKAGPDRQSDFALNRTDSPNECHRRS
jgi:hypothetical protein